MVAGNVAQLEILGQKVEVSTPQALEVGTTINVAIHRNGQNVELVIQPDSNARVAAPTQPLAGAGRGHMALGEAFSSFQRAEIEDWVLAAQAAINEAVMTSEAHIQNANPPPTQPNYNPAMYTAYPAAAIASQTQLQAEIRARYELDAGLSDLGSSEAHDGPPFAANKASQFTLQQTLHSSVSSALPGQPASNSALVIQAPFQLQQMQHPILLTIRQDDENGSQPGPHSTATKRWTVNFSFDAGTIGPIQVTIGLSTAAVSVKLSSEQIESASLLNAWLPELKAALEQADFAVDELSVRKTARSDTANSEPILL